MSRLVVFDVDGTFLNSQVLYDKAVLEYSRANGLPPPDLEAIRLGYGDPHAHDFGWGVSKDEQARHMIESMVLADSYSMSGAPEHTPPFFDGVRPAFAALKDAGYMLAIVTSKPEAPLLHILAHYGVQDVFSARRTFDDVKRRGEREKPAPDMLQSVMRELGALAQDTVMVGDTTMDMRMGVAAGARAVGVAWGMHPRAHLQDAGAHVVVEGDFSRLPCVIDALFARQKTA